MCFAYPEKSGDFGSFGNGKDARFVIRLSHPSQEVTSPFHLNQTGLVAVTFTRQTETHPHLLLQQQLRQFFFINAEKFPGFGIDRLPFSSQGSTRIFLKKKGDFFEWQSLQPLDPITFSPASNVMATDRLRLSAWGDLIFDASPFLSSW